MCVMKSKRVWGVLGISIVLSGCLKIEATTTVLEDGKVIDQMVVQPKNSLLALLSLSAQGVSAAGRGSDTEPSRMFRKARQILLLQDLRNFANVCKVTDLIYKEELATQRIPYSAVSIPTDFEFSEVAGSGCSIQIGPYDPRILPADFAGEMLGIRIELTTGFHAPYRMSVVSIDEALGDMPFSTSIDSAELQEMCSGEFEPALCQQELGVLLVLIESWNMEGGESNELGDILSDPGMLGGTAEMLRMVLKSVPMTMRIPDNTAVNMVYGTSAFEYGQGWIWRGSAMEWITASTNPGISLQIRPTRHPTPSTPLSVGVGRRYGVVQLEPRRERYDGCRLPAGLSFEHSGAFVLTLRRRPPRPR